MIKKCVFALALLGTSALCGCYTYDVKAFDLSGKLIYQGTLHDSFLSGLINEEGKTVRFYNATVVLEEK